MPEHAALDEIVIARAVAAAVQRVPGVAGIGQGRHATATYGPNQVIRGVGVTRARGPLDIDIHLTAAYGAAVDLPELAERVREAARAALDDLSVEEVGGIDVTVEDLRVGGEQP
ncbi:Asp23/Gls24 family envelope stress response protein [Thermomicrobiaceae bacterium CFH 74404]|uniref:Asp23/Gls24 family envelope stress response protein n=1 Tax=Thermalbibacter longus TaxID=2951981 RepID=A0AA42BDD8_9BACT|nr:Asp23/Gls24 family envelope stress response protein [Thermalbibacter longus]MCM8749673.1 Asp23/Gls24 family envelope stress response protein [Thermalbibacter longus]